jgi:hypothetical protein
MVVITAVTLLQRNLVYFVHTSERVEKFVEGEPAQMVVGGRLDLENMERERYSREDLLTSLRLERVEHLGQVKCAYLEENGQVSAFLYTPRETRPGLPIIPPWRIAEDQALPKRTAAPSSAIYACTNCGETLSVQQGQALPDCPRCEGTEWVPAVGEASDEQQMSEEHEEDSTRPRRPFVR